MQTTIVSLLATALVCSQALALPTLARREECGDDTVNVASSFSPSIQCSDVLSDDDVDLSPDISILRREAAPVVVTREEDMVVAKSEPLYLRSESSADSGVEAVNVAARSSRPLTRDDEVLENDTVTVGVDIDILGSLIDIDVAATVSTGDDDEDEVDDDDSDSGSTSTDEGCGDDSVNVASSFSPSVQCSEILSNDTVTVDPTIDIL